MTTKRQVCTFWDISDIQPWSLVPQFPLFPLLLAQELSSELTDLNNYIVAQQISSNLLLILDSGKLMGKTVIN